MYPILSRKFGSHDLERFDQFTSPQVSVGGGKIGKVKVDCRFKFEKSQWGVLGAEKAPAGIIYLDLDFHQPADCQLKYAVVTVTLGDMTNKESSKSQRIDSDDNKKAPVHLKPWYGPQQLFGQPRELARTKKTSLTPHAEFMGMVGAGGVGRDYEETSMQESRWSFSGSLLPGKASGYYKTVQWALAENELEPLPLHSNVIHTAFSLGHSRAPFYLRVEVSGKLQNMHNRVRHRFQKFASSFTRSGSYATTLIEFGGQGKFQKPLDALALGLRYAMEKENFEEAPVVVPKTSPDVQFQEDTAPPKVEIQRSETSHTIRQNEENPRMQADGRRLPIDQGAPNTTLLFGDETSNEAPADPTQPTATNLVRAFATLTNTTPDMMVPLPPRTITPTRQRGLDAEDMSGASSVTTRVEEEPSTVAGHNNATTAESIKEKQLHSNTQVDPQVVLTLLRMTGLFSVMQVIAALLESMGVRLPPKT